MLVCGEGEAQDPAFSMPFLQKTAFNPAFTGMGSGQAGLSFRDQLPGSPVRYITSIAEWDQPFDVLHGGVGVIILHDMAGGATLTNTGLSAVYSYHLRISRDFYMNAGFQASVFQSYLNTENLILPDMISPSQGIIGGSEEVIPPERKIFPDFSVGFLFYEKNWYAGVAAHHLMEPYQSDVKTDETVLPRKYSALAGFIYEKDHGNIALYPWAGAVVQGRSHQTLLGLQVKYFMGMGGICWKKNFGNSIDMLVFSMGIVTKRLRFSYSYDAYLGKIAVSSAGGAHEIGIIIEFGNKKTSYQGTINWPLM